MDIFMDIHIHGKPGKQTNPSNSAPKPGHTGPACWSERSRAHFCIILLKSPTVSKWSEQGLKSRPTQYRSWSFWRRSLQAKLHIHIGLISEHKV